MKQTKLWIGFLGICLMAAVARETSAAITIQDGIPWVYEVVSGGATILHGPGCGDVIVPAELDCYPVRFISSNAFALCSGLTSVTLPGSVTGIGAGAFSGCTGLKTLCLPLALTGTTYAGNSGVPSTCAVLYGDAWEDVGGLAWSYVVEDGKATVTAGPRQGNVTIPAVLGGHPVTGIGSNAFYKCNGLTSVKMPNSMECIGSLAFCNCSGLTSVTIPDSVTSIGDHAFYGCSGLTSATIGDSVTNIARYVFHGCTNLTSVTIGNSVTSIGDYAFYQCSGLTSVTIPDSVTSIGENAFYWCSGLMSVTIGDSVTSIGDNAFFWCFGLTSVTIGDSVTSIGYSAFSGCHGLSIMTIPDSVTNIGDYAFRGCSGLTNVTIPDSVTSIGEYAFGWCSCLTNMTVGGSVTNIGRGIVTNCSKLATMKVPVAWQSLSIYVPNLYYWPFWSEYAGVPEGCEIIYGTPPETPKTTTGVPYAWLEEQGLGDGTAEGYEAAAAAKAANRAYTVADCYVAGLDPTDPAATFTADMTFTNGALVVSWTPDLNEGGAQSARSYEVQGRPTMADDWDATNSASRFFRVRVELPTR